MGGRIIVESVAGCLWNRWPDGRGIRINRPMAQIYVIPQIYLRFDVHVTLGANGHPGGGH